MKRIKKIIIPIVLIIILIIIILFLATKHYYDAGICGQPQQYNCAIIKNKTTRMVYLYINQSCNDKPCNEEIKNNNCKPTKKRYLKIVSKEKYEKIEKELYDNNFQSFTMTCKTLEEIINK